MPRIATLLRWTAAFPVAAVAFIIGVLLVNGIWRYVGGDPVRVYLWSILAATLSGGVSGVFVAPSQHRRVASYIFGGLPFALLLALLLDSLVEHDFKVLNALDVGGATLGGIMIVRGFQRG